MLASAKAEKGFEKMRKGGPHGETDPPFFLFPETSVGSLAWLSGVVGRNRLGNIDFSGRAAGGPSVVFFFPCFW